MDADTGECSFGDGFYQSLLNDSPVGFALVSTDGRWLRVNRAISRLLGYSPEELSKLNFQKLTHPDDLEADLQLVDDLIAGRRENYRLEKRYVRKDGSIVWGLLSVSMSRDERGRPAHFISQIVDMTDVREIQRELEHKALHDPLTGLPNRRKFQMTLTEALESARRTGKEHCLCFMDLDGFKAVNDTAGHEYGDMVLVAVSRELEKSIRSGDQVARFGGDEFGIILFDCGVETGRVILERLRKRVSAVTIGRNRNLDPVTASIGVAAITPTTASARDALRRADLACYEAKRAGRNVVRVHGASVPPSNVIGFQGRASAASSRLSA